MSDRELNWRPTASLETLSRRAQLLREARTFFADRDVLEVETPTLTIAGVTDPTIGNVACQIATHPGRTLFLQSSPEYAMKRLLAAGSPDIYQICKVFRDGELGSLHQPEFTMIEWYRKSIALDDMIDETCALVQALARSATPPGKFATPSAQYRYQDLFIEATGVDPLRASPDELRQCADRLTDQVSTEFAGQLGEDRNAWLDFLMSHVVIPELNDEQLVVVHHYPADQAALARLDPDDERFAERFEIFYRGIELANGYRELCDPVEQRRRLEADRRRRIVANIEDIPIDNALLAALDYGLPECCGVAVGFDRLVMAIEKLPTIARTMSFGW
jgi:lysyl-tRNA synthetase class 2